MRTFASLILNVAFVAAVILPIDGGTDVGTHDVPAAGGKQIVAKAGSHLTKPNKSGPAVSVVLTQLAGVARCSGCISEARLGVVPPSVSQHSPPLLI